MWHIAATLGTKITGALLHKAVTNGVIKAYTKIAAKRVIKGSTKRALYRKNMELRPLKPYPTKVTVHRHEARAAGLHWDFRFRYPVTRGQRLLKSASERLISFVFKKKPPLHADDNPKKPSGWKTNVIRSQDHKILAEDFEGEIPEGQYGAGLMTIEYQSPGVVRSNLKSVEVFTPYKMDQPWSGWWEFIKVTDKNYIAIRHSGFTELWFPRRVYEALETAEDVTKRVEEGKELIAERKVDGANFIIRINAPFFEIGEYEVFKAEDQIIVSPREEAGRAVGTIGGVLKVFAAAKRGQDPGPSFKVSQPAIVKPILDRAAINALKRAFLKYEGYLPDGVPVTLTVVSRRYSVEGYPIHREGNVPHMSAGLWLPERAVGMVLRGELWHPDGANVLSGMLNASPENAVLAQKERGLIRLMVFDWIGWATEDGVLIPAPASYMERRTIYEDIVGLLNESYYGKYQIPEAATKRMFTVPKMIHFKSSDPDKAADFFRDMIDDDLPLGEGIIIKDPNGLPREDKWYKVKRFDTYDLKIVDILPGTGRLSNSAGKVAAADATGKVVAMVGSGFTDEIRDDMWLHPEKYKGRVIEVRARDLGKEALRAPRFIRFRDDKDPSEIDIVPLPANEDLVIEQIAIKNGISKEEAKNLFYAFKTASGWRPNK